MHIEYHILWKNQPPPNSYISHPTVVGTSFTVTRTWTQDGEVHVLLEEVVSDQPREPGSIGF